MKAKLGLLLFAVCAAAMAQGTSGYVFAAPGGLTVVGHTLSTLQLGGGVDAVFWKGLGVGAELSAIGPTSDLSSVVGMFSPNGTYHFVHEKDRKVDPFVTAGYTLLFRSGTANLVNFGAGLNYWFRDHAGLRVEFRDHVYTRGATLHYWGVRLGLSFR
jgi:hypothetical protein